MPTDDRARLEMWKCEVCHGSYENRVKHWGKKYTGICKACQRAIQKQSRADAAFWREEVIRRSKGDCEVCGFHCPLILVIHHVKPVARLGRGNKENLIALCPNCHAIVHSVDLEDESQLYFLGEWLFDFMPQEQVDRIDRLIANLSHHASKPLEA